MRYITTTKNLLIDVKSFSNTKVENGIVYQVIADTHELDFLKVQLFNGDAFVKGWSGNVQQIGKNTLTFTTDIIPEHTRVVFGLNGVTHDMTVFSPITLENNTTYTLSMDFINITQGEMAWTNSMLEKGSTATPYVPYGYLPMYKGRYKVSDICQLLDKIKYPATQTINGVTFINNGDGTITANGTATDRAVLLLAENLPVICGKGLIIGDPTPGYAFINYPFYDGSHNWVADNASYEGKGKIFTGRDAAVTADLYIAIEGGHTANNLVFKPQLFDLTEMYGAGNEPTTVAEFREKFPDDLYPYSPYCWAKIKSLIYKDNIDYIKMK